MHSPRLSKNRERRWLLQNRRYRQVLSGNQSGGKNEPTDGAAIIWKRRYVNVLRITLNSPFRLHLSSAGDQHEERPHRAGHLWGKLAEQVSGCGESKPKRGSLSRMSDIVKAGRKLGIAHESAGGGSYEVRYCRHRMSGVRAIHEGKADGVDAPCENAAVAGRDVARIFARDHTRRKSRSLKADPLGDRISIVSSKCLSALPPL
jgi:hypothetical protein